MWEREFIDCYLLCKGYSATRMPSLFRLSNNSAPQYEPVHRFFYNGNCLLLSYPLNGSEISLPNSSPDCHPILIRSCDDIGLCSMESVQLGLIHQLLASN